MLFSLVDLDGDRTGVRAGCTIRMQRHRIGARVTVRRIGDRERALPVPDDCEKALPIDELSVHVAPLVMVKVSVDASPKLIVVGLAEKLVIFTAGWVMLTRAVS